VTPGQEDPPDLAALRQAVIQHLTTAGGPEEIYGDIAQLIDAASDEGDEAAVLDALDLAGQIEPLCDDVHASLVRYARSNAWDALRHIRRTPQNVWSWSQPELVQQIYWLRSCVQHPGHAQVPKHYRAQMRCNLGNALSGAGRFVDALAEWRMALNEQPNLGMAHGNLGEGLVTYAKALYDGGHAVLFLQHGRRALRTALEGGIGRDGATYLDALNHFASIWHLVDEKLRAMGAEEYELGQFSLGRSKRERNYRRWVLDHRLFLNPLNDLLTESVAAQDVLMLPSHQVGPAGITFLAFYNQLKQEYAFARWNLFEGTGHHSLHPADRRLSLAFNADYAQYSMAVEQVKIAYRCAYSLFDKIAYFVNDYWKLGIPERGVSFRSIWVEPAKGKAPPQVRAVLEASENLPLRGLFWLSKDLFDPELKDVAQPEARDLDALRNHLEHKNVKVVDAMALYSAPQEPFVDRLAHQIVREDLEGKTLRLLQLARAALIYLSLAMEVEERRASAAATGLVMPLAVDVYPESLKR
jgi:tetratricopeptide (TPR) repeat protein